MEVDFGARRNRVSLLALSKLLDVDRSTIERWVNKQKCPVLREGIGRGAGNEWQFDVPAVWAWHADWLRSTLTVKRDTSGEDADEQLKLLKLAREASLVVPVDEVIAMQARVYAELRQTLMAVPDRIARTFAGFEKAKVDAAVDLTKALFKEALEDLAKKQVTVVPEMSDLVRIVDDAPDAPTE